MSGNDLFKNTPWWVRATAIVGFPAMIAGVLLWVFIGQIGEHQRNFAVHQTETANHVNESNDQRADQVKHNESLLYVLQVLCQNQARNMEQHEKCVHKP